MNPSSSCNAPRIGVLAMLAGIGGTPVVAPLCAQEGRAQGPSLVHPTMRNPGSLAAQQVLDTRDSKAPRRVRFEWEPVGGAIAYLLTGTRSDPTTWALQSVERRVSRETAASWDPRRVAVELPLGPGAYSWKLVALFSPGDQGDFIRPTTVRFDVR